MYIQFLAHYAPDAGSDLADLCLDISSIIMERSTLLPAVLPGTLCKTPVKAANDTYAALLRLFIYFMGHVRRRADQPAATQWGQVFFYLFIFFNFLINYNIVLKKILKIPGRSTRAHFGQMEQ